MVKSKPKKTINRKASLASLLDIRTANDAADKPPVPPLLNEVTGQRRSRHNHTTTLEAFENGTTLNLSGSDLCKAKMRLFMRTTSLRMMMGRATPIIENLY
jgi:hypothetical protein